MSWEADTVGDPLLNLPSCSRERRELPSRKPSRPTQKKPKTTIQVGSKPKEAGSWSSRFSGWFARWRKLKFLAMLATITGIIGFAASYLDLWDRTWGLIDPSSQPAAKADLADIRAELERMGSSLSGLGATQIDAELSAQLEQMLGSNSTPYRIVTDHLRHGRLVEATNSLDRFAQVDLQASPPNITSAVDKLYLAGLLQSRVNLSASASRLRRALELDPTRDDVRSTLTIILLNQNNISAAGDALQPALSRAESSSFLANSAGLYLLAQGDLDGAERYFRIALNLIGAGRDPRNEAAALGNLGNLYDHRGDLANARRYYLLSIAANAGNRSELDGNQYCNLGRNALQSNNLSLAETYFQLSIDIFRYAERRDCLSHALNGLGTVRLVQNHLGEAESLFRRSWNVSSAIGDSDTRVVVLMNMALVRDRQHNPQAKQYLIHALDISLRQDRTSETFEKQGNIILRLLLDGEAASHSDLRTALSILATAIDNSEEHSRSFIVVTLSASWLTCALGYYDPFGAAEHVVFSESARRHDPRLLAELARGIMRVERRYQRDCGLSRNPQI